jgi:pyridoxine 5-phosphate synthase
MTRLSVNLNKVALLRNARTLGIPSVTRAAETAIGAGAGGITIHPRPDQRHIRSEDVRDLAQLLRQHPDIEFNIEGNPFHGLVEIARAWRPHQCTLVPDEAAAVTSDHGWDIARDGARLQPVIAELRELGIRVSVFMDPLPQAMAPVRALGADRVELYTEPYASAFVAGDPAPILAKYTATAHAAQAAGLGVNAGHDLNQENLPLFLSAVPGVLEVSIGHALIADALDHGLAQTVRNYLAAIAGGTAKT